MAGAGASSWSSPLRAGGSALAGRAPVLPLLPAARGRVGDRGGPGGAKGWGSRTLGRPRREADGQEQAARAVPGLDGDGARGPGACPGRRRHPAPAPSGGLAWLEVSAWARRGDDGRRGGVRV